ncbi:MAG TPA: alpha/beta hydrolase [Streptosporangiaceae bacterium]
MPFFVLVHSPSVGPATWQPVADRLRKLGYGVAVPSLLGVADGEPPYWRRVVAAVTAGLADAEPAEPLVLVAHSNAGVFVPVILEGLVRPVACSIFADAAIPGPGDVTPMAPDDLLAFLRGLAGADGRLPPWTDWWDEQDVAPLFPSAQARQAIAAEQPRLPLAYYLEQVPAPRGWDDGRCAYLLYSQAYADSLAEAQRRGWPALSVPGEHLHQVVDPDAVARAILELAGAEPGRTTEP